MLRRLRWLKQFAVAAAVAVIVVVTMTIASAQPSLPSHPLDPLTEAEISTAVAVVRQERSLSEAVAFANISLQEPNKDECIPFLQ